MTAHLLDTAFIAVFLILSLVIGIYAGRKTSSAQEYAIANKDISYPVMLVSIIATMIGGGMTVGHAAEIYQHGIIFSIAATGAILSTLFVAKFIAHRFDSRFNNMLSIGDIIQYFYGNKPAVIASLASLIYCITLVAFQIIAFGNIAHLFLGIQFEYGALIAGTIIIIYSSFGGIHAVTKTDILQFTVLIISFPTIAFFALKNTGGIEGLKQQLPHHYLEISSKNDFYNYLTLFIFMALPFLRLQPEFIQRCLMIHNPKSLVNISYKFAFFSIILLTIVTIIALCAACLFPHQQPNVIIPLIINQFMPIGIKGLVITGLLGVLMSTADSCLNTGTILLTHNIIKPKKNKLYIMKLNTLFIGTLALIIGINNLNIFHLAVITQCLLGITASIPLFFALLELKVNKYSYYFSLISGLITFIICTIYNYTSYTAIFLATIISSATTLLSLVYRQKKSA